MSVKNSKFLSLILRHAPEKIGIELDEHGWTDVEVLLEKARIAGTPLAHSQLLELVNAPGKKRFVLSDDQKLIRAAQGHSVTVDLRLKPEIPPDTLFHGTALRFLDSILEEGLNSGKRNHVHLSKDIETAIAVGKRHGKPVVLTLDTQAMMAGGQKFWLAENGVWLTTHVLPQFLTILEEID